MGDTAQTLIALGAFMLAGLVTDFVGRRTPLPRVTLLLLLGVTIGPAGFDVLPVGSMAWFPALADIALVMVGFLLGGALTRANLRRHGRTVVWLSVAVVVVTALTVLFGLLAMGVALDLALLLAAIATATAPAATVDVAEELNARGPFTTVLLGIVAADDAWALIIFSLFLAAAQMGNGSGGWEVLAHGGYELGGALLLGLVLGVPMAYLTGRIRPGEPTLIEALGIVLLCGGLALWLEVSFLLAAMVLGATVANLAKHHTRPFHAIKDIEWPFLVIFFLLSGATLELDALLGIGVIGAAYVALRIVGRLLGARWGGRLARADAPVRNWMGLALLPQAGVALGMALVAADRFPHLRATLIPLVIGATVVFEIIGPISTRFVLRRVGEVPDSAR